MSIWLGNLATAMATILSLSLALIAFRSWWKTRSTKILLLGVGFSLFAVKAVVLSLALFTSQDWESMLLPVVVLDVVALVVFYTAVLR